MKKLIPFLTIMLYFSISTVFGQVEVKGTDSTSATITWFTSNAKNSPDTTMVVLDDGKVGIGTTTPSSNLEVNGIITADSGIIFPDGKKQTVSFSGSCVSFQHVFTVAKLGGDYSTIDSALSACTGATAGNGYLIRVMPGTYSESVNCLPYVHLKGAGKYSTVINGSVFGADSCIIEGFFIKESVHCLGVSPTIIHNIITTSEAPYGIEIASDADGIHAKPWVIQNEIIDCLGWGIYNHDFGSDPWIIGNKILRNSSGGIKCENTSPLISNNYIYDNHSYGIYLIGALDTPAEPTIDDNVIASSDSKTGGIGIYMINFAEPRIIANDIYICKFGIWIAASTQPSIIGNNINYNFEAGIVCNSNGSSKPIVIKSNHIHSNVNKNAVSHRAGIYVMDFTPIITHNNIHNNPNSSGLGSDIDYSSCTTSAPMISLNVYDVVNRTTLPNPIASGQYNVTSAGGTINP
jgi:parallel beta-helix repeat protein